MDDLNNPARVLLLLLGGLLVLGCANSRSRGGRIWWRASLVAVVTLSIAGYFRYGELHGRPADDRPRLYHYHDLYHYYIGAKYYSELGNVLLYECTYVALRELEQAGVTIPPITVIRSLSSRRTGALTERLYEPAREACRSRFSEARWNAFRDDVGILLSQPWPTANSWQQMLVDHGNNSPPPWNLIAGFVAKALPSSASTLELVPWIDIALVFIVIPLCLQRVLGFLPTLVYLLVFSNNWLAAFHWTGGGYCRYLWLAFLAVGLCFFESRRTLLAGFCLGAAAAVRIFPVFFVLGAILACFPGIWRKQASWTNTRDLLLGTFAALAGFGLTSLAAFGSDVWSVFADVIRLHAQEPMSNTVAFYPLAAYSPGVADYDVGESFQRLVGWEAMLEHGYAQHVALNGAMQVLAVLCAATCAIRLRPALGSLVLGMTLLFFFSKPAGYYHAYPALLAALFVHERPNRAALIRQTILFVSLGVIATAPLLSSDVFVEHVWASGVFLVMIISICLAFLFELYLEDLRDAWTGPVFRPARAVAGGQLPRMDIDRIRGRLLWLLISGTLAVALISIWTRVESG